jgi:anti-sigma factor RsiW
MMKDLEDTLLFSYVDGELDANQRMAVEEFLAHDPVTRQKIAQFKELNILIRAAYSCDESAR